MPTFTTNYNLAKPLVDDPVDEDLWGGYLNDDMDTIDTNLKTVSDSALPFLTAEQSIASAATVDLGATTSGNVYITGTTTITSFGTAAAGVYRKVRFADILTLTWNATSMILPSGANITTAANDELEAFSLGSGNWILRYYTKASGLPVVSQTVKVLGEAHTVVASVATGTTLIPTDNSIPQNTEGNEYMTLAYTPSSAASTLKIDVVIYLSDTGSSSITAALFRDSTANALGSGHMNVTTNDVDNIVFTVYTPATSTATTTFKVRGGSDAPGTTTFNGVNGAGLFGGTLSSSITITELAA
jgi:hypothetical protein